MDNFLKPDFAELAKFFLEFDLVASVVKEFSLEKN